MPTSTIHFRHDLVVATAVAWFGCTGGTGRAVLDGPLFLGPDGGRLLSDQDVSVGISAEPAGQAVDATAANDAVSPVDTQRIVSAGGLESIVVPGHLLGPMVVLEATGEIFVSSRTDGSLLVFDGETLDQVAAIPHVGQDIRATGKNELSQMVVVFNAGLRTDPLASTISFVDGRTRTVVAQQSVYGGTRESAMENVCVMEEDVTNERLWLLSDAGLGTVDPAARQYKTQLVNDLTTTAKTGWFFQHLANFAVNPRRREVYLPDIGHYGVWIYHWDTNTYESVPYPSGINQVTNSALDAAGSRLFLWNDVKMSVFVLDVANREFAQLDGQDVANYLTPMVFNPYSRRLFLGGTLSSDSAVVDPDSTSVRLIESSNTASESDSFAVRYTTDRVFLVDDNKILVIDGLSASIAAKYPIVVDPATTIVYSSLKVDQGRGNVYAISDGDTGRIYRLRDISAVACKPQPRDCRLSSDRNCDGVADDTTDDVCRCSVGSVVACDEHPGLDGVGPCHAGSRACVASPGGASSDWTSCAGSVGPQAEACDGVDNDCDGLVDEECPCPSVDGAVMVRLSNGNCIDGTGVVSSDGGVEPCAPAKTATGGQSGSFGTTADYCFRTSDNITSWNCSNFTGRTLRVNGIAVACGSLPLPAKVSGYYYFDASAGGVTYASIYWY